MRHGGFVLAYHGCDLSVGKRVLAGKAEIKPSDNEYDWLGGGAYFWENNATRARDWAKFLRDNPLSSRGKVAHPFVIGAIIDPGNCLDLTEARSLDILKAGYESYAGLMKAFGIALPVNESGFKDDIDLVKRKLDCAVINFLHFLREKSEEPAFDTVRCPFFEGKPLFRGSGIRARTHLQWCVRDPRKSVVGYFRPRPGF